MRINTLMKGSPVNYEINQEAQAAAMIVRIALAYCNSQDALSGQEQPAVYDRQWQACCAVASRFLADPEAMTPQLCHHEWRLSQMRSSHPRYWPTAARTGWDDLSPMDQYAERAGLAAMREAYLPHPDVRTQYDAQAWEGDQ